MTIMAKLLKPKKPKKLKLRKLGSKVRALARTGVIGPKQLAKLRGSNLSGSGLRGSQVPTAVRRGGVGKGMAGM
jgi:hypothetical protein